jgi:hypothetical protein
MGWAAVTLQAAIGVVLLIAALMKVIWRDSPRALLEGLAFPPWFSTAAARTLPIAEGICGLMLVAGIGRWPALLAVGLAAGFVTLLVAAWRAGVTARCGCFGPLDAKRLSPVTILRAAGLLLGAVTLVALQVTSPVTATRLDTDTGTIVALGLGGLAALVYLAVFGLLAEVWAFQRWRSGIRVADRVGRDERAGPTAQEGLR